VARRPRDRAVYRRGRPPGDRQGRLLAYVFTQEGTFVNAWLIEFGFAEAVSQADLSRLEREAREKSRGLWMRQ